MLWAPSPFRRRRAMRRRLRIQVAVAALALFTGIGIYMTTLPKSDAFLGVCTYYQTAAKKKVVGQRGTGCCGEPVNWGVVTPYKTCEQIWCADVWCPPPTE
jgi:uncharacterized protein DUF6289